MLRYLAQKIDRVRGKKIGPSELIKCLESEARSGLSYIQADPIALNCEHEHGGMPWDHERKLESICFILTESTRLSRTAAVGSPENAELLYRASTVGRENIYLVLIFVLFPPPPPPPCGSRPRNLSTSCPCSDQV